MSNLTIVKSKNQIGVGTNQIQLTNSLSSALNIKKNDDSYSFLEFNTSSNTIGIGTKMETNALITFKGTTKVTSLSKGDLVYLDSTGNWAGVGPVGIGSYIKVNSGGTGLQWTNEAPIMSILSTSPLHVGTLSSNSDNIIITFDDIVVAGTGNIVLTPSSGPVITIDVTNTSLVSFSSNICTINPNSNLDSGGLTYTVTMNSGVIKNSNGVLFSGILSPTYQFNSKDTITPIFTNLSPGTNTYINNTNIGYTLSESFASGTVTFTSTGGTTDSSSPQIQVLSGSELNAGTRNIGALTDAPTLVSGTIYTIGFDGIDSLGNVFSTVSTTGITFDNTNPIISSLGPTSSSYVNTSVVSYTLSETLASGTVTFTRISGNADSNHTVSLAGIELDSGSHNNTTLTNAPTLVNGTVYSIAFNGIDLAENSASQVSVTDITYDTTAPTVTNIINNSTSTLAKTGVEVTLTITANEAISQPTVIFNSGNTSVTNSTIYSGSGTTWTAKYTVHTNDTDGNVTITVTATDLAGNSTTSTSIASGSVTVDTTAPVLSSASSIGTTTDTTPNLTFSTTEIGTITSSLAFTSSTNANVGNNTITFSTLSNNTYSNQWIKITDSVGNVSNTLTIPTFIIAANPYGTTDIRYYNWIQDQQLSGVTRGDVGYVRILGGPDSNPGNLQPNGDYRGQPGSLEDWQLSTHSQTYDFGYIVMPNPSLPNTVTPTYNNEYGAYSPFPADWGQSYNNYRYKITRQSNGNFILENPWQGLHFDTYNITGSSTQWEFIKHSSNATNGDPLWRIRITTTDSNGKYLSIRTVAQSSYAGWVYGAYGYGYSDVLPQRTGWSKQLWRLDFL